MLPFHTQTCACRGSCRAVPVSGGEDRIACPFKYRDRAFKYEAPTALQCPNGVQIWGHAAPAVSKGVHHGFDRRCHGTRVLSYLSLDDIGTPMSSASRLPTLLFSVCLIIILVEPLYTVSRPPRL